MRWHGFGSEHDTWEAATNILDKSLIAQFEEAAAKSKEADGDSEEQEGEGEGEEESEDEHGTCGTPGCTLPDFHLGPCSNFPAAGSKRERKPSSASTVLAPLPKATRVKAKPGEEVEPDNDLPGWTIRQHTCASTTYLTYQAPNGEVLRSKVSAMRRRNSSAAAPALLVWLRSSCPSSARS